jgi:hypothetical protein
MQIFKIEWIGATSPYFTNPKYGDWQLEKMERAGYGVGNLIEREVTESDAIFLLRIPKEKPDTFDYDKQCKEDYLSAIGMA